MATSFSGGRSRKCHSEFKKKQTKNPPLYRYQVNQENEKKKPLFGFHHNGMVLK